MTGAMRKMGVYLGLVEDDAHNDLEAHDPAARTRSYDREEAAPRSSARAHRDDRYDYDDAEVDNVAVAPAPALRAAEPAMSGQRRPSIDRYAAPRMEEAPVPAPAPAANHRITTLHPRTYNEARTIGEQFRDGSPVIMNLSEMDDADAKRLVDFAAGLTFGLRGSIERITARVFLLSPQKVKVTAEDKARIADGRYPTRG